MSESNNDLDFASQRQPPEISNRDQDASESNQDLLFDKTKSSFNKVNVAAADATIAK